MEESLTSSPLRIELVLNLEEESLQGGAAMHLEAKRLTSSPCGEGFTGKDSCAFKGKKPFKNSSLWEGLWRRIAVHLKKKKV